MYGGATHANVDDGPFRSEGYLGVGMFGTGGMAHSSARRIRGRAVVATLASSALLAGLFTAATQSPASAATPPVAVNDAYSTTTSSQLVQAAPGVLANDTDDGPSSSLPATVATNPAHGTLTLSSNGSFTYKATANFVGADTFTYTVSDGVDGSSTGTVT